MTLWFIFDKKATKLDAKTHCFGGCAPQLPLQVWVKVTDVRQEGGRDARVACRWVRDAGKQFSLV